MKKPYDTVYKLRGILMTPPYMVLVFATWGEVEHDQLIWTIGAAIFFAGLGGRIWAQMHLHFRLHVRKILTCTGPYQFVRNPIYISNTLIMLGLTVMSELVWFLPIMLVWCAVLYSFVVRREELHLLEKYGEPYQAFLDEIPRWMPSVRSNLRQPSYAMPYLWASIGVELHCLLWPLPLIGKELWHPFG